MEIWPFVLTLFNDGIYLPGYVSNLPQADLKTKPRDAMRLHYIFAISKWMNSVSFYVCTIHSNSLSRKDVPCHYLNQCWFLIKCVLWLAPESNFTRCAPYIYPWNEFQNYTVQIELRPHLPGAAELGKICFVHVTEFYSISSYTVYPKKYAHGFYFAVLCCGYTLTDFPISIRLTSLALWQSNDYPSASKATLMNMDKYFMWIHYERLHNHNKAKHNKTVCIFLGIYCKSHPCYEMLFRTKQVSCPLCTLRLHRHTVYPKKYAHGVVVLCFVVVMQSFIMNSHEVFIHIHQGCFAGTGAIVRLPQCQWSKPDGYGKISQCITTTKHSKAKTVCIFLGIYCILLQYRWCLWTSSRKS